jgi:hypothetical protein
MSLRMPGSLSAKTPMERGASFLDAELQVEKGASLGRAGRAVIEALETLSAIEAGAIPGSRREQVDVAAGLVWELIVQQEACGIRNPQMTYREYKVPRDVIARVGGVKPKAGANSAGVSFVKMMRSGAN